MSPLVRTIVSMTAGAVLVMLAAAGIENAAKQRAAGEEAGAGDAFALVLLVLAQLVWRLA